MRRRKILGLVLIGVFFVVADAGARPGTPPRPVQETYHPPVPRYIYHPPARPESPPEATQAQEPAAAPGDAVAQPPPPPVEIAKGPPRWGYLFYLVPVALIGLLVWLNKRRRRF